MLVTGREADISLGGAILKPTRDALTSASGTLEQLARRLSSHA